MQNKTIHSYTLKYLLGEGGMAEVWYAENNIGKPASVKVLNKKYSKDETVTRRFEYEARIIVNLKHPNVRQVSEFGMIDERPCIVMEYLEGNDLSSRMKRGEKFDDILLQHWWNQLADTLNYIHQHRFKIGDKVVDKIVHRDIKPSNIFLTDQGDIKLLDFGIAKIKDSITKSQTETGSRMGTLMYMSPEQAKDSKNVDYRSDIYSLAVTFYHLLSGKAPYPEKNQDYEIQSKIVQQPLLLENIPQAWVSFLQPYLEKDPDKRPLLQHFEKDGNARNSGERDTQLFGSEHKPAGNMSKLKKIIVLSVAGVLSAISIAGLMTLNNDNNPEKKETHFIRTDTTSVNDTIRKNDPVTIVVPADTVPKIADVPPAKIAIEWVDVPAGTFIMGSSDDEEERYDNEYAHKVSLNGFKMSKYAITFDQYDMFCEATGRELPSDKGWGRGKRPVINVSWHDANAFAEWLGDGYRLPTEAEWEYACRAGTTTPFHTGDNITSDQANYAGNYPYSNYPKGEYRGQTLPVGSFSPNNWGLYDMHGNVFEWCSDWYDTDYYKNSPEHNPQGPSKGTLRVLRGGSWLSYGSGSRSAFRYFKTPADRDNDFGFRLVFSE
ncbi:MAG: SUMF1/EgtB/PvdO family nonheme iron enzyme [Tannerella sp.]|jgi:formylglycine-generating enzyme required for sulfatase activity/tRNA A-37 threonylcarbamoyl transferase component Bud32|nr:SUMF1/EgtB/PvdO family nonheme iron enzyme [Tannerella sp.]